MTALSILVYPLHSLASTISSAAVTAEASSTDGKGKGSPLSDGSFLCRIISVALPASGCTAIALWGSAHYRWGVASGMSVGVLWACLGLKTTSFAQVGVLRYVSGTGMRPGESSDVGSGESLSVSHFPSRHGNRENDPS